MTIIADHHVRGSWTEQAGAAVQLPPKALAWLNERVGETVPSAPIRSDAEVPGSLLTEAAAVELAGVVGERYVLRAPADRLARTGGLSYLDLLSRRLPGELPAPDAVVLPADPDEVQAVLEVCVRHDVGVVPFGGGTSVVGGVRALRGGKPAVIVLDLARLDRLVSVDPESRIAVLQAGVRAPHAEELLAEHGFTLGHVPQSFERATIGGFAATRSAGQASSGYGRFEDMVAGVRLATPAGPWRLGVAPASAAGPDLRQLAVGSEGTLGVITEVALRVRPRPVVERYHGYVLDGWERAQDVVRELAQNRILADVTRLSDEDETDGSLRLSGGWKAAVVRRYLRRRGVARPCLLVLGWHGGSPREIALRRVAVLRVLRRARAVSLGRAAGESWRHGRFAGPRQRDALLDHGICVETLETATTWSRLGELRAAVRSALAGALGDPLVLCHISHAYETGASLYFTVLTARDATDPVGQWQRAKEAACAAISSGSDRPLGTISHHHAVGTDHAPYLAAEIGELGMRVLAGAKDAVDPTGILNPGKLITR
ncbi:FAD-binding oxidoreductase [Amycolatopsis suaedae]|uniref:FAD-binding oxidoreductase n=1 Tax=Amycolatopsis suaedae TaxID=2510978 RepID=A0A4Q7JAR9_9PSEU|nr:FAD-binding oxidoreductase [Amycolatopsis suaedae]RZQ63314.1 FAD-binding oxidoreductase [Amycolatopsis suaedae]